MAKWNQCTVIFCYTFSTYIYFYFIYNTMILFILQLHHCFLFYLFNCIDSHGKELRHQVHRCIPSKQGLDVIQPVMVHHSQVLPLRARLVALSPHREKQNRQLCMWQIIPCQTQRSLADYLSSVYHRQSRRLTRFACFAFCLLLFRCFYLIYVCTCFSEELHRILTLLS